MLDFCRFAYSARRCLRYISRNASSSSSSRSCNSSRPLFSSLESCACCCAVRKASSITGSKSGGFSGIIPCFRRMSFLDVCELACLPPQEIAIRRTTRCPRSDCPQAHSPACPFRKRAVERPWKPTHELCLFLRCPRPDGCVVTFYF